MVLLNLKNYPIKRFINFYLLILKNRLGNFHLLRKEYKEYFEVKLSWKFHSVEKNIFSIYQIY